MLVSGQFRTHDRGRSAGDCANSDPDTCGRVAPWNAPGNYINYRHSCLHFPQYLFFHFVIYVFTKKILHQ